MSKSPFSTTWFATKWLARIGLSLVDWIDAMTLVGAISPWEVTVISFVATREKIKMKVNSNERGIINTVA